MVIFGSCKWGEMYCYDWSFHRLGRLATSRLGSEGDDRESQTFMADLSDLIRPTALTLRLSEIYNNEWLFAYESLMSRVFNEKKVIGELLSCITVRVREQAVFASLLHVFCHKRAQPHLTIKQSTLYHVFIINGEVLVYLNNIYIHESR